MKAITLKVEKTSNLSSFLLVTVLFGTATVLALILGVPVQAVMSQYQYNVLVILIVMELFTNLVCETGVMQYLASKLALRSNGNKRAILAFFGILMFAISAFLNNITAIMIILPVIFVLLKAIDLDRRYMVIFFSCLLAVSNTGGASSPIGDFPAITIMTSGITTFSDYLFRAMPIFMLTTAALVAFWSSKVNKSNDVRSQELAVKLLYARYKHCSVDRKTLIPLVTILAIMFLAWSFVPQDMLPPEMVAVLGYVIAVAVCSVRGKKVKLTIDFKGVLTIAAFLFMASVISETGILVLLASLLQANIGDPRILLIVIMLITSIVSGLCSAGPAAAAMMPIIVNLCQTTLVAYTHWVAIAYAAAICAGSSLFMWSATAGFILSNKVEKATLGYSFGVGAYLKHGIINYLIQMGIALIAIALIVA